MPNFDHEINLTIWAQIYGDPIFFGSGSGFGRNPIQVLLIRSDPVRILLIRSDPIRSDPIRLDPVLVL